MATMAGRYCCSYNSPSVLPLQQQRRPPTQLQPVGRGGRGQLNLRVAASAAGGTTAEPVKAVTDAEFFQPSDTRPIMLFDGAPPLLLPLSTAIRERTS
jgi:hypothetical protein